MKCYTDIEFADADLDEEFLIDKIVPRGGLILVHAKRTHGKSQFAMTMAHAVINGGRFLDTYDVDTRAGAPGRVAYIQCDQTATQQQTRIRMLHGSMGRDWARDSLLWFHKQGRFNIIEDLDNGEPYIDQIRRFGPDLLVVDTLRRAHPYDENASDTPSAIYDAFHRVWQPATKLFLHHDRKTTEFMVQNEAFRGAGAWLDDANGGIHLVRKKHITKIYFSKVVSAEEQPPITTRLNPSTLLLEKYESLKDEMHRMMQMGAPKKQIVDRLMDAEQHGAAALSQTQAYKWLEGYK